MDYFWNYFCTLSLRYESSNNKFEGFCIEDSKFYNMKTFKNEIFKIQENFKVLYIDQN